jgi:hypothetical protein
MSCGDFRAAIVEAARGGTQPSAEVRQHIAVCAACSARWDSEQVLSAALAGLRSAVAGEHTSEFGRGPGASSKSPDGLGRERRDGLRSPPRLPF